VGLILVPFVVMIGLDIWESVQGAWLKQHGYHVGHAGWQLAEEIVQKHWPATDCQKFRYALSWSVMGPTEGEQQSTCIHRVAELTHDPTVCEFLLPDEYAMSCVGVATIDLPCVFMGDRSVLWHDRDT